MCMPIPLATHAHLNLAAIEATRLEWRPLDSTRLEWRPLDSTRLEWRPLTAGVRRARAALLAK